MTPFTSSTASGQSIFQKTQGTSASAGVLATFHQQFKPWLGYNVNAGNSRFTENYTTGHGLHVDVAALVYWQPDCGVARNAYVRVECGVCHGRAKGKVLQYVRTDGWSTAAFSTSAEPWAGVSAISAGVVIWDGCELSAVRAYWREGGVPGSFL